MAEVKCLLSFSYSRFCGDYPVIRREKKFLLTPCRKPRYRLSGTERLCILSTHRQLLTGVHCAQLLGGSACHGCRSTDRRSYRDNGTER